MRIGKSRCVESNWTHCCTEKFNVALSLCGVLEVAFYFSKSFSKAVAEALCVKNKESRLNIFYFIFDLFSFILFLELVLGLE